MMVRDFIMILLIFISFNLFGQEKLTKIKIEKELEFKIPVSFTMLTPEEIINKYLSSNAPMAMYGNVRRTTEFGVTKSPTRWSEKDSEILLDFYKSSITSTYTKVHFHKETIVEMNGQKFMALEFTSSFKDTNSSALASQRSVNKYTNLYYALRNGSLYVFNFSAPAKEREKWKSTANNMMKTIKFL